MDPSWQVASLVSCGAVKNGTALEVWKEHEITWYGNIGLVLAFTMVHLDSTSDHR